MAQNHIFCKNRLQILPKNAKDLFVLPKSQNFAKSVNSKCSQKERPVKQEVRHTLLPTSSYKVIKFISDLHKKLILLSSCHPSYTDKILSRLLLAVCFAKIYGCKNVTISLQVSLTKSSNGAMLTPFVKPCQVLVANLKHKIACKFHKFLSSKTRKNWS